MTIVNQVFKLVFQFILVITAWYALWSVTAVVTGEVSNMTPPGAKGITFSFLLLVGVTFWLIFVFAWVIDSLAPTLGASFWVAADLAQLAYIDTRTWLFASIEHERWQIYKQCIHCGCVILILLFLAIFLSRIGKSVRIATTARMRVGDG